MGSACRPGLPEVVHAVEWFGGHSVVSPDELHPAARGFFHLNGCQLVVTEHPLELRKSESLWDLNRKHSTKGERNQHFMGTWAQKWHNVLHLNRNKGKRMLFE